MEFVTGRPKNKHVIKVATKRCHIMTKKADQHVAQKIRVEHQSQDV